MRSPRSRPRPGSPGPVSVDVASPAEATAAQRIGMDRLADKWSALLLDALQDGAKRFAELRTDVAGISEKMLTQTLRSLERDGMVERKDYGELPPRVEYALTELGRSLTQPLLEMCAWSKQHLADVEQARKRYDHQS